MIKLKLPDKLEKERYDYLIEKDYSKLSDNQRDFVLYMRIKEEIEAGLE